MSKSPRYPSRARGASRSCVSYHPNENLAEAIVQAWSDPSFRRDLLTFGEGNLADWATYNDEQRASMLRRTSMALAKVGVYLEKAVVLTTEQYASPEYQERAGELMFVLPDPVGPTPTTLATARVAMAAQCCGI